MCIWKWEDKVVFLCFLCELGNEVLLREKGKVLRYLRGYRGKPGRLEV